MILVAVIVVGKYSGRRYALAAQGTAISAFDTGMLRAYWFSSVLLSQLTTIGSNWGGGFSILFIIAEATSSAGTSVVAPECVL